MRKVCVWLSIVAILGFIGVQHSNASRPVPRTITGCVIKGKLYSIHIGAPDAAGNKSLTVYPINIGNLDLAPYEGKKIQVHGKLLPSDRFIADLKSLRVLGPCDKKARRAISEKMR
jgi:hypothetical protein